MKRLLCFTAALLLALLPAAAGIALSGNTSQTVVVTVTVESSYTVVIPEQTAIVYNTLSTALGNVGLSQAQLEPGYQVIVAVFYDALKNNADSTKTIPYILNNGGTRFVNAAFTGVGSKALTLDIAQTAWEAAAAGSYSDTITFVFNYGKIPDT